MSRGDVSIEERVRRIEEARARVSVAARDLREGVRAATDWRRQVTRHPILAGAVALGAGFLVAKLVRGALAGPRRRPARDDDDGGVAETVGKSVIGGLIARAALTRLAPVAIERGMDYLQDLFARARGRAGGDDDLDEDDE